MIIFEQEGVPAKKKKQHNDYSSFITSCLYILVAIQVYASEEKHNSSLVSRPCFKCFLYAILPQILAQTSEPGSTALQLLLRLGLTKVTKLCCLTMNM